MTILREFVLYVVLPLGAVAAIAAFLCWLVSDDDMSDGDFFDE